MHTSFYASGFLYHQPSQQILLQQFQRGDTINHTLFRAKSRKGGVPRVVFQKCVEEALGVSIPSSAIHPVYDYIHDNLGEHFVFFVDVSNRAPQTYRSAIKTEWLTLSKLSKFPMSEQTRHDIIIGERVIRSLLEPPSTTQNPKHH